VTDEFSRRAPVGAEIVPGGVHFRVWAPDRRQVEVIIDGSAKSVSLKRETEGYFSGLVPGITAGALYKYRLDGGEAYPDPASRYQPRGPHHASQVVDPRAFTWTDANWPGVTSAGQVIYEFHVGTFTQEGTWKAAAQKLKHLVEAGVTVLEMMPVSEFSGEFGWGYDGVHPFAPTRLYGSPDDLRRFVDSAHAFGLAVILDVVYNHLGPDGNYFGQFSKYYFTSKHKTDWGQAINFDGENSTPVREFFISNAAYWISEYHFDGLRLDATQSIFDDSKDHVLAAISRACRLAAWKRSILLVAENEVQEVKLVRPQDQGGYGFDMLWNDDFHHSAMVALAGNNDAYYTDYLGTPQEFLSAVKYGFLYQGQWYRWQAKRRGTPTYGLPPATFVTFTQNHDQVGNSPRGLRARFVAAPNTYRAVMSLTLLAPGTPMLFQGQEFGASSPFYFFADHNAELRELVYKGRIGFMSQFRTTVAPEMEGCVPDPGDRRTFERCKLDWSEADKNEAVRALYQDLLRLRRSDPVFRAQRRNGVDGAVLSDSALVLRFFGGDADDRLLIVNLGVDLELNPAPQPLLAPPEDCDWTVLWSSENLSYGGCGTPPLETTANWWIPGRAAVVLKPVSPRADELPSWSRTQDEVVQRSTRRNTEPRP
jgi:maltooligosyltrehalose trehalohydrolase